MTHNAVHWTRKCLLKPGGTTGGSKYYPSLSPSVTSRATVRVTRGISHDGNSTGTNARNKKKILSTWFVVLKPLVSTQFLKSSLRRNPQQHKSNTYRGHTQDSYQLKFSSLWLWLSCVTFFATTVATLASWAVSVGSELRVQVLNRSLRSGR